jgi:hypothetical protein
MKGCLWETYVPFEWKDSSSNLMEVIISYTHAFFYTYFFKC